MNKKLFRRLLALALALCLVFSLSACGKGSDDEDPGLPHAEAGGSDVPYADGFDTTAKFNTGMNGDTLCIAFNGIQKRDTGYFQPAGARDRRVGTVGPAALPASRFHHRRGGGQQA